MIDHITARARLGHPSTETRLRLIFEDEIDRSARSESIQDEVCPVFPS